MIVSERDQKSPAATTTRPIETWLSALALWLLALAATALMAPRAPVYWDSFGYIGQSVTGLVGGLALGRPHFIYLSHAISNLLRAGGVSVWSIGAALTVWWAMCAAFVAPLTRAVALASGVEPKAALLAGVLVALSPAMAHTAGAVLTDGPSLAVTLLAFVVALRGAASARPSRAAFIAGALIGIAAGMREQAAAQGLVTLLAYRHLAPRRRLRCAVAMALGFALAFAPPVLWAATHQQGYGAMIDTWLRGMRQERGAHPYTPRDALAFAGWLAALGPLAAIAGIYRWIRAPMGLAGWSAPLLAVCAPSLLQLALLAGYQDISYSPRYLLPALPGALAIPAALSLARWMSGRWRSVAVGVALIAPLAVAAPSLRRREAPLVAAVSEARGLLRALPADALVVAGQTCPVVELTRRLAIADGRWPGGTPRWQRVCAGWGWPADLAARLDAALDSGRTVAVDLRPGAWIGPRQRQVRDEVARWERGRVHPRLVVWR